MELTRDAILSDLRRIYGEELEYPAEVLDEGADLEFDLGVDSLARAELLVRAGERFGVDGGLLTSLSQTQVKTLGRIADQLYAGVGTPAA